MKTAKKSVWAFLMAIVACVVLGFTTMSWKSVSADQTESDYGFTSNNDSGKIEQVADGVMISAKSATTGDIFDYTYDTAVNPTDVNVVYTVLNDTTRGAGDHSRMLFYILPSQTAELSEGAKIELAYTCYDSNMVEFTITEGCNGFSGAPHYSTDYSVNLRVYKEGDNWYLNLNGARYDLNDANKALLNSFGTTAYIRTSAHWQDNGASALGMDVIVHSIDGTSFGTGSIPNKVISSKKTNAAANANQEITEKGLTLSGQFNEGVGTIFTYGGQSFEIAAGELASYTMTFDASEMDNTVAKYFEISFTNILQNDDRMSAWDNSGDAATQPTITALTYRFYNNASDAAVLIAKYNDGSQGTFNIYGGQTHVDNAPYYEFPTFPPRADGLYSFNLMKYDDTWKVLVNGACLGFENACVDALNELNAGTVAVSFSVGSGSAASAYAGTEAPVDKVTITGLNGAKLIQPTVVDYKDEITGELEFKTAQWVNIAPDSAEYAYTVVDNGLRLDGYNGTLNFAAGINYTNAFTIDQQTPWSLTLDMGERVYASNSVNGEYSFFLGSSTHVNFIEADSIYFRVKYASNDLTVDPRTTTFTVEIIVWDYDTYQETGVSGSIGVETINIAPKTTEGRESEVTFYLGYDENTATYGVYVNGQRATSSATETVLTQHINETLANEVYFASVLAYGDAEQNSAWTGENTDPISMTIVSLNGQQIVNKEADIFAGITLSDATEVTATSATLNWTKAVYPVGHADATTFTPTGYKVVRVVIVDGEQVEDKVFYIDDVDTVSYAETDLQPSTSYYYSVYAVQKNADDTYTELFRSNLNKRVTTLDSTGSDAGSDTGSGSGSGSNTDTGANTGSGSGSGSNSSTDTGSSTSNSTGGCGSVLGCSGVAAIGAVLVALGAVRTHKRKED